MQSCVICVSANFTVWVDWFEIAPHRAFLLFANPFYGKAEKFIINSQLVRGSAFTNFEGLQK